MRRTRRVFITLFAWLLGASLIAVSAGGADKASAQGNYLVYVGTYTDGESKGIYAYRFDARSGQATPLGLVATTKNPSFLAIHPNHRFLYAVNEVGDFEGKSSGAVSAFAINPETGQLALVNEVASRGADPCYVSLDNMGKYVMVANYTGGSVAVFPVREDGGLGAASSFVQHTGSSVNPRRQEAAHAHQIGVSPDNRFALATDLGLDELVVYPFQTRSGSLAARERRVAKLVPGAGPRHFVFHPNGRFVYVINELYSTVSSFSWDAAKGTLHPLQTVSALPKDFEKYNDAAEIAVHPTGKFLYASNRGHDSIAVFRVDPASGTLTPVDYVSTQGKTPRNFAIDPTGAYVFAANQESNNIVIFRISPETGGLTATGQVLQTPAPVSIAFMASE
jgi:6-phosphogluconolactonase